MSRVEENLKVIQILTEKNNRIPEVYNDKSRRLHLLGNIASLLADISSSLAVIADSVKEEKS